ncbi:MAG: YIP1 family protein [Burkholderiales bacterium]
MNGTAGSPKMSEMGRVIGVFISPVKTFQDIARKPTWVVPLLLLIVSGLVASAAYLPHMDWEKSAVKQADMIRDKWGVKLTDQQIDQQIESAKRTGPIKQYGGAFLGPLLITLIPALIYFAVIRLGRGMVAYAAAYSVVCFASLPGVIRTLLTAMAATRGDSLIDTDLAALVPSNFLFFLDRDQITFSQVTLGQATDLFEIWSLILTILGLSAVSTWSRGRCAAVVLIPWVVFYGGVTLLLSSLGM